MSVEGGKGAEEHVVANREVKNATIGVLGEKDVPQSLISFEGLMSNSGGCGIITMHSMGGWLPEWLPSLILLVRARTRRLRLSARFMSGAKLQLH
jgi:hypothetical protein